MKTKLNIIIVNDILTGPTKCYNMIVKHQADIIIYVHDDIISQNTNVMLMLMLMYMSNSMVQLLLGCVGSTDTFVLAIT